MTVTAHRSAAEIGRTTAGPRPLPPLGATREVPLPELLDVTLPTGLRVLAAHRPGVPMAEIRLRVPFGPDPTETDDAAISRHLAAAELLTATLLTGTAGRDRVAIDDELAVELPDRLAAVTPEQVRAAAAALRGQGRAVLVVEPGAAQPTADEEPS